MTTEQKTGQFINIATLVSILTLAGGMLAWTFQMTERVASVEERVDYKSVLVRRIDDDHDTDIIRLQRRFDKIDILLLRIEDKLDEYNGADS